jgi:hypothetical protein
MNQNLVIFREYNLFDVIAKGVHTYVEIHSTPHLDFGASDFFVSNTDSFLRFHSTTLQTADKYKHCRC